MGFLKKLFGGETGTPKNQLFNVQVAGSQVPSVFVDHDEQPGRVLDLLMVGKRPRAAIFITGGAGNMSDHDKRLTREIFEKGVAAFAEENQIIVIDGATDSGVIEMMASARRSGNYTFPLIGVAPHKYVTYPGYNEQEGYPLAPGHSHFVFVTGDEFGAESEMIIHMAHTLAGGQRGVAARPVICAGIVVNGGKITRQEVYMATTKDLNIPLVVMEGSGRFSDDLATAVRTGETSQSLLRSIIRRGDIELVATTAGPEAMRDALAKAFSAAK